MINDDLFGYDLTVLTHKEVWQRCVSRYYEQNKEANFTGDMEQLWSEFEDFGPNLKRMIHQKAWDDGHASGYYDVYNQYFDLVRLAECAIKESRELYDV